ncbi:MAG: RluA family pseudouridine synthase [Planctomycetota bacterium]
MSKSDSSREPGGAVRRLDVAAAAAAGVSRRRAQRLIADGVVTVNGRAAGAGDKGLSVGPGDVVAVRPGVGLVVPEPEAALDVLAEGPGWVAAAKPAGVAVHPLREGETGTLLNAVAARYPQVQGVGAEGGEGGLASGVVHRLDVATSGVVLLALDEPTWVRLRGAFAGHRVEKRYRAVVAGRPEPSGRADVWLAVTRHRPARVSVVDASRRGARRCGLSWRTLNTLADATEIEVDLETGFLHQVRVTLAHLGHPVLGDRVYGGGAAGRLMLHAASLRFEEIEAVCPPPPGYGGVGGA